MRYLALLVVAGCMTPVMKFGEGKTAKQAQHDTLTDLVPATLSTQGRWKGEIRDARIRVYADDQYRAQNLSWKQTFEGPLQRANAVLGPNFGLRLVAEYQDWDRHAPAASLLEDMQALFKLDRGDDVFAVVGLTSSLGLVSATFDALGYGSLGGKHIMLRGYADVEERAAFARAFPDLPADERDAAHDARRRHKTTAVLLHELGHNMGAEHEIASDTLMNETYSKDAATFSPQTHALFQRSVDQRVGRATDSVPQVTAAAAPKYKTHPKMVVVILETGVMIDGQFYETGGVNMRFSTQAAVDPETEVVISKDPAVSSAVLVKMIDSAKAQGLKSFTIR